MNRKEIAQAIYEKFPRLNLQQANGFTELVFATIGEALARGETVRIMNFGVFDLVDRKGFTTHHAAGGTAVVPDRRVVVFRPAKELRQALNAPKT